PRLHERLPRLRLVHPGDRLVVARVTHEAHLAGTHLGERHRGDLLLRRHRVERELRLVGARRVPAPGRDGAAGLVVDDRVAAARELVDAVDARVELEAGEADLALLFDSHHGEVRPALLDLEPLARDAGEARALQLREPALELQLLHRSRRGLVDRGIEIALQGRRILQDTPQALHQLVYEVAALPRVEAFRRFLQILRREAVAGEGAERTRRLVGEDFGAAADLLRPDGG